MIFTDKELIDLQNERKKRSTLYNLPYYLHTTETLQYMGRLIKLADAEYKLHLVLLEVTKNGDA